MKVYIQDAEQNRFDMEGLQLKNTSAALGTFDAMHVGHTAIIRRAVQDAKENGRIPVVSLFLNLPANVVSHKNTEQVYTFEEKCRILEEIGVEVVLAERFTEAYMQKSYVDFFQEYLLNKLDAKFLSVGFNYHFGQGGQGDVKRLAALCEKHDITFYVQPCVQFEEVVSSTHIRELLLAGEVDRAAKYLGRYFTLSGEVIHGNGQGHKFGFPTANMEIPSGLVPRFGVYISQANVDGTWYPSVTNIGEKPTVKKNRKNVETHLLDFSGDLYGKKITVRFIKFIRGIQKFQGIDELIAQVERDKKSGYKFFAGTQMEMKKCF